ncbi:MAG TPA: Gfo/Idh/MocA family oxidoreductase, partial [Chloroflexota bacterium]|nr:Gfo/Idh/MocA family oxidoreductase [Chloroflexota bacterium]
IPAASTEWSEALRRIRPDIVCLGTPGTLRRPVIELAAELGCHLYCDKPLGTTAAEAVDYARIAERGGIKHAYASTHRYDPSVAWMAELVQDGAIGTLLEMEGTFRRHLPPLTPWTWYDTLETGGGLLNNAFPHWLGILKSVTGGDLTRAMGESRIVRHKAPYVPDLHDFRDRGKHTPTAEEAERLEWRECDADNAFTALLRFSQSHHEIQATVSVTGAVATWPANGWRLFGTEGTLIADGHYSYTVTRQRAAREERESLPAPPRLLDALPSIGDEFENKWAALAREFVADVRGEPHQLYLTFQDGACFQQAIEAIRDGRGWTELHD